MIRLRGNANCSLCNDVENSSLYNHGCVALGNNMQITQDIHHWYLWKVSIIIICVARKNLIWRKRERGGERETEVEGEDEEDGDG